MKSDEVLKGFGYSKSGASVVVPVYSNSPGSLLNAAAGLGSLCYFRKAALHACTAGFPSPKLIWNDKALSLPRVSEPSSQPCETDGPWVTKTTLRSVPKQGIKPSLFTHSSS